MSRVTSLLVQSHEQKTHYQNPTRVGIEFGRDGHHQVKDGNSIFCINPDAEFHIIELYIIL